MKTENAMKAMWDMVIKPNLEAVIYKHTTEDLISFLREKKLYDEWERWKEKRRQ